MIEVRDMETGKVFFRMDVATLEGQSLCGARLKGNDFSSQKLSRVDLTHAAARGPGGVDPGARA